MASDTLTDPNELGIGVSAVAPAWMRQPGAPGIGAGDGSSFGLGNIPLSDTFKLHSRPSATKTIYLDFDGFTARFTPWRPNGDLVSPPFDLDGNPGSFSDIELASIQRAWQAVAADFAPFEINVTTEDPGEEALVNTGGSDDRWGIRAVITTDDEPARGTGGVAFFGSFRWGYNRPGASDTPCYVFNLWEGSLAQTISHEAGHSVDLRHDGRPGQTYYPGHGSGETGWGAIMGAGFGRNLTTWSDGSYFDSNNREDDLLIITSTANGVGFIADDIGNSQGTAAELTGPIDSANRNTISQLGRIERPSDLDFFRFQVGSGLLDLTIDPYITQVFTSGPDGSMSTSIVSSEFLEGTNMDIEATLMNAAGEVIAISNPVGSLKARLSLDLEPGIYYLRIDGVGFGDPLANPPTGYTDYGSLGQYLISGSFPVAFGIAVSDTTIEYIEDSPPIPIASSATVVDRLPGDYSTGSMLVEMVPGKGATDFVTMDYSGTEGLIQIGNLIYLNGSQVARLSRTSETTIQFFFTSSTDVAAIESIANSLRFEARGDSPDTFARSVLISLNKGVFRGATNIQVDVVSVNDAPQALAAFMDEIDEDATNPVGNTVGQLIEQGVFDPDLTRAVGMVLTGVAAGSGRWQYDVGTGWRDVANLSTTNGLVLGPTAKLRFRPATNFFGNAPSLRYYALDPFYEGGFSGPTGLVFASIQSIDDPTSVSVSAGEIRQVVRPVNDAPVAVTPFPRASVLQDATLFFTVPTTLFTDVDDTVLTMTALSSTGGPLPNWLVFDSDSRTFRIIPRNEHVGQQQFLIRASDPSGLFADAPFTVDVINVNDAPTTIRLVGQPVPENAKGARVGRLTTIDPDPNDSHTWTVEDSRFEVRGNELFLNAQTSFDFETEPSVSILARVTDNGTPRLFLETTIAIAVADVNEFAPQLTPLAMSVNENSNGGFAVGTVTATDGDTANRVRYRFFGTPPSQFVLNADSGILSVKPGASLDYETVPVHEFFVEAYDDGVPSLSTWVSAVVSVLDVNEFSPAITTQSLSVVENHPVGQPLGRVVATDADQQTVSFSLLPSEDRFTIDPVTGDLRATRDNVFDYERSRTEIVTVIATDSGTPSFSSERQIVLQVTNANEPPTSVSVGVTEIPANITGVNLGTIEIEDPDGPTQYVITSLDSRFQVVAGQLVLGNGQYLRDSDPTMFTVQLLMVDTLGGLSHRANITLERLLNPTPWQNTASPLDVDRNGSVDPLDALAVINAVNSFASPSLPVPRDNSTMGMADVDVDGDGQVTPLDVLAIINALNTPSNRGEGESSIERSTAAADRYFAQIDLELDPLISRSRRWRR